MDDRQLCSLIEAAQTGDRSAFGELVQRFQDMAYGYAYAVLKDFRLVLGIGHPMGHAHHRSPLG